MTAGSEKYHCRLCILFSTMPRGRTVKIITVVVTGLLCLRMITFLFSHPVPSTQGLNEYQLDHLPVHDVAKKNDPNFLPDSVSREISATQNQAPLAKHKVTAASSDQVNKVLFATQSEKFIASQIINATHSIKNVEKEVQSNQKAAFNVETMTIPAHEDNGQVVFAQEERPTWTSTGFLQGGLQPFRKQIEEWKDIVPKHPDNKTRYLVFVCENMCGGWGDRQEGIVAAYLLARLGGREFYIQLDRPCPFIDFYIPNRINWTVPSVIDDLNVKGTILRVLAYDEKAFKLGETLATTEIHKAHDHDVIYFGTNQDYFRYFSQNPGWKNLLWASGMTRAHVYAAVWEYLFKLSPSMEESFLSVTSALKKHENPRERYKLACGQFRTMQNPSIPNDQPPLDELDNRPIWDFLQQYNKSDEYRIFVATDAQAIRHEAQQRFPAMTLDVPGDIIHIDRSRVDDRFCQSYKKVILDQLVLASCDVTMRGYLSHLGCIAAYFRGRDDHLFCYESKNVRPCSMGDERFHYGPEYRPGMVRHWEPFIAELKRKEERERQRERARLQRA